HRGPAVRAVLMRGYGEPSVLCEETVPDPADMPGRVLVRLEAAALNWHDVLVRRGQYGSPLPHVPGASGGVATMAVSLAAAGAGVTVTSASPAKIAAARELGAAGGVDHAQDGWTDLARELTPRGEGFDLVLDPVGRWAESLSCLRPGGRCVVLGASVADR